MAESKVNLITPVYNSAGVPAPARMSYQEFLDWTDEDTHAEWVDGEVIMPSPNSYKHQDIQGFLHHLIDDFGRLNNLSGRVLAPFHMKLPNLSGREPDLIYLTREHLSRLENSLVRGPADLVVEIISPESIERDRQTKFEEYRQGGVPEYWLIDPISNQAEFYQLAATGQYQAIPLNDEGKYYSRTIQDFWLKPDWLWQQPLPEVEEILLEVGGASYARYTIERLQKRGFLPPNS